MEDRIKEIYNACWHNYKLFLADHDMDEYNKRSKNLVVKYGSRCDIADLLLWFAPRVQTLYDIWRKEHGR